MKNENPEITEVEIEDTTQLDKVKELNDRLLKIKSMSSDILDNSLFEKTKIVDIGAVGENIKEVRMKMQELKNSFSNRFLQKVPILRSFAKNLKEEVILQKTLGDHIAETKKTLEANQESLIQSIDSLVEIRDKAQKQLDELFALDAELEEIKSDDDRVITRVVKLKSDITGNILMVKKNLDSMINPSIHISKKYVEEISAYLPVIISSIAHQLGTIAGVSSITKSASEIKLIQEEAKELNKLNYEYAGNMMNEIIDSVKNLSFSKDEIKEIYEQAHKLESNISKRLQELNDEESKKIQYINKVKELLYTEGGIKQIGEIK